MLKSRRLDQVTARVGNTRLTVDMREGVAFVVRGSPERAAKRAKRVVGRAKVGKSVAVKR